MTAKPVLISRPKDVVYKLLTARLERGGDENLLQTCREVLRWCDILADDEVIVSEEFMKKVVAK